MRRARSKMGWHLNGLLNAAGVVALATAGCGTDDAGSGGAAPGSPSAAVIAAPTVGDMVNLPSLSPDDEQTFHLLATIDFPGRGNVKFYEPSPGFIFVAEAGRNGISPLIPSTMKGLTGANLFERLSNQPAPPELLAATERANARRAARGPHDLAAAPDVTPPAARPAAASPAPAGSGVEQVRSALTFASSYDQWFFDNFCAGGVFRGNGWQWQVQWMGVTGTGSYTRYDTWYDNSTVSVFGGDGVHHRIEVRPWYSWSTYADLIVKSGFYYNYHRDADIDFNLRITMDQAAGDSYHYCGEGYYD